MNKKEILARLKSLNLDPDKIMIVSGAALVVQGIIENTNDIDMSCDKEYYDKINWPTKIGAYGLEIKYNDCFEIGSNLYFPSDSITVGRYRFMNIKKCLEIKEELNREKDKYIIEKLKSMRQEQF